ncbi:alpha/beta hydrolase [Bdellovibrio reynosensis]|uniref:Alpha/beta hydrolase n=1 Tax=Bdellovibrio reynosensis TaxID=2835041 RepID=A0ABY4CAA2_9BACT|nr:alpha/beta fold hydrolase [Bdellovibrio reynosensis]UOF00616.1 alpha/beta hydrolase [Bdellovibrio reynosensis]
MKYLKLIFLFITINLTGCSSFLYWPTSDVYVDTSAMPIKPQEERVQVNPSESLNLWILKTPAKKSKGVFVQFHGNAQNLTAHFQFLYWVLSEGYDLVTFDYRGYGQSTPYKPTPESTTEDAKKIIEYVSLKFPKQKRIFVGQSLGGAVMLKALSNAPISQHPEVLVLDSSFASYKAAARSVLKQRWFLYPLIPFSYLAFSDEYAPKDHLKQLGSMPKVVIHGKKDPVIRYDLGEDLFNHLPEPKVFWTINYGYHTAAFTQFYVKEYSKKLIDVIEDPKSYE